MTSRFAQFKIFSMLFGVVYTIFFYFNWAPFQYYPAGATFSLHTLPIEEAGPAILWYAWLAAGFTGSLIIALIFPRKWAEKLPSRSVWLVPALLLLVILIYEKRWFV